MVNAKSILTRSSAATAAAVIALAGAVPLLFNSQAGAVNSGGVIDNRVITMSSALYNDGASQGTNVTYSLSFDVATNHTDFDGLVVEFCDETPIPYDTTCTAPTGFDESGASFSNLLINGSAAQTPGDWTSALVGTAGVAIYDSASSGANDSLTAGQTVSVDITGIDNPTLGNYAFYARIYTWDSTTTGAAGYTLANPDVVATAVDAGGVALSSVNVLRITSKVQERLTFCIHTTATCTAAGTEIDTTGANRISSIALGDDNGVLSPDGAFVSEDAKMTIQTNALYDAAVYMKGDTLASGSNNIEFSTVSGTGGTATTAYQNNYGNEQFGFCVETTTNLTVAVPYGSGTENDETGVVCNTATANNGAAGSGSTATDAYYGFDITAATGASGDLVATKAAGPSSTSVMNFIGNISYTTEAGIYTTDLDFIATGTF